MGGEPRTESHPFSLGIGGVFDRRMVIGNRFLLTPALSTVRWKRRQGRGKAKFEFEFDRPNTAGLTRLSAAGERTLNKTITKKAEPPPTRGVACNRSGNGGWLRRLVRRLHWEWQQKMLAILPGQGGRLSERYYTNRDQKAPPQQ